MFRQQSVSGFGKSLAEQLKRDAPKEQIPQKSGGSRWANAARLQLAQEQRALTAETAAQLLMDCPQIQQAEKILDLGGGPGLTSQKLLDTYPQLQLTLFDFEETIEVAQSHFADTPYQTRVNFIGGDFSKDDIGEGYDIIWCSSIFYFAEDVPALLTKLYRALKPGGLLVSLHAEIVDNVEALEQVYFYYFPLLMRNLHVFSEGELSDQLKAAGFEEIQQTKVMTLPMVPMVNHLAQKPINQGAT